MRPYRNHGTQCRGAGSVFDPAKLSFESCWSSSSRSTIRSTSNRQGNDRGSSYRSGDLLYIARTVAVAQDTIADVNASPVAQLRRD